MPIDSPSGAREKRCASRVRRFRQARCIFHDGASSLDVTLRDISPSGARIAGDQLYFLDQRLGARPPPKAKTNAGEGAHRRRHCLPRHFRWPCTLLIAGVVQAARWFLETAQ